MASIAAFKSVDHAIKELVLTSRQLCDLELILNGGFSPLQGFMNRADYESVLYHMHLADGTLWPMPITLDVDREFVDELHTHQEIALCDAEGLLLAFLKIDDIFEIDRKREAKLIFNT